MSQTSGTPSNLVLIGMRCTGKSSVGRLASEALSMGFADADVLLAERAGRSIREIFEQDGEAAFRALESDLVRELAAGSGQVIATGGGVVLDSGNVRALRAGGFVVHLAATPEIIHERIVQDTDRADQRPALTAAAGSLEEVRTVWAAREALYRAARHAEVSTQSDPVHVVARRVVELFKRQGADQSRT